MPPKEERMFKRKKQHPKELLEFIRKVEFEHSLFKFKMLSSNTTEVYNECNKIHFYECIYEYVVYSDNLDINFVNSTKHIDNVISVLYQLYLKYENLNVSTWNEIEELIQVYLS